ncbi:MAG: hypothetical protein NT145_06275 [Elusimicrobia bacterium]|nr:hypothetical protein [Elusimicrobiota bacterium]
MKLVFFVNILVPLFAGLVYLVLILELNRVRKIRKIMFGEMGYKKMFFAFLLLGIYLVTRPLQNLIGPHPWPMLINCLRQSFLMAFIAPSILVGIFHWIPDEKNPTKAIFYASYISGILMALIFVMVNFMAVDGSKLLGEFNGIRMYDPAWFSKGYQKNELVFIHLISQFISPVGFLFLASAYVRHKRHNYDLGHIYDQMILKWKYLEGGLLVFAGSFILAGFAAFFGQYYTYLWAIYFIGAIIAGILELRGIQIPPRSNPADLR